MVLEYYLVGGTLRIGKKEAALELLRKDSALRPLLGYGASGHAALNMESARMNAQGDFVTIDFSQIAERKLNGDPTRILNELKQRYGAAVGGKLHFKGMYTSKMHIYYCEADLDAAEISLRLSGGGWKGM